MSKKIFLLVIALSGINSAYAGGANAENYFDGPYVQVEAGFGSLTNKTSISPQAVPLTVSTSFGATNPQVALTAGYSREIVDFVGTDYDINLAANISYNFTNGNSGN